MLSGATKLHRSLVLTEKLKRFTAELNQLNAELQSTGTPDMAALSEFHLTRRHFVPPALAQVSVQPY